MIRQILSLLILLACTTALAQGEGDTTTPVHPEEFQTLKTAGYALSPVEGSGISGSLQVTERVEGGTRLVVSLQGASPSADYAAVLYQGDCGPDREQVLQLTPVNIPDGDPGSSLTDSELSYDQIVGGDHFLYIFAGEAGGTVVACGEVGLGANTSASPVGEAPSPPATDGDAETATTTLTTPPSNATQNTPQSEVETALPPEATRSLRTLSYALSPVEGSGISGNLQVTERIPEGTRLTVSLEGIPAGGDHAVVLYRGDCGPDRPEVLRLSNVNAQGGSPNSSTTDAELSFDAITQGDHFLYVFQGEPGSQVVACGEVGLGANP